jgi:hypothetical protein
VIGNTSFEKFKQVVNSFFSPLLTLIHIALGLLETKFIMLDEGCG